MRTRANSQPAAAAMNSGTMSRKGGSAAIVTGSSERACARFGDAQRPTQPAALVEQLGDPIDAPEQPGNEAGDECEHERETQRRRDAQERELDLDTFGI